MKTKSKQKGLGCLILFFLPFACVGLGALYFTFQHLAEVAEMGDWVEVPATILSASSSYKVNRSSDGDSKTYYIKASYRYEFEGRSYSGSKVGAKDEGGFGLVYDRWETELRKSKATGKQFRCFVNPEDPRQAVLYRTIVWDYLAFLSIFTLAFGGVGFGGIAFVRYSARIAKKEEELQARYPQEPWRWKEEWLSGRILSSNKVAVIGSWAFAIFWNAVSSPLLFVIPKEVSGGNMLALIGLLFPLVGLGALVWAIRATIRFRKFGQVQFAMPNVPGVLGGELGGDILLSSALNLESDLELTLSCTDTDTHGSGKNRSTTTRCLWQEKRTIPRAEVSAVSGIPVRFTIPYTCQASDSEEQIKWTLRAEGKTPGIDFVAEFEVPVFRTPESDPELSREITEEREQAAVILSDSRALENSKLQVKSLGEGTEIHIPPVSVRVKGMVFGLFMFAAVWTAIVAGIFFFNGPIIILIGFGLFELLFVWALLEWCTKRFTLVLNNQTLRLTTKGLLRKKERVFTADEVARVDFEGSGSSQSMGKHTQYYSVFVELKGSGKKVTLASWFSEKDEVRELIALIKESLKV